MATRSRIAIEDKEGLITSIYCHWDGYPNGVGRTLLDHFQDRKKVKELILLGDISSLSPELKTDQPHSFDCPTGGVTVAYHRDRGEDYSNAHHGDRQEFEDYGYEAYGYLFTQENKWEIIEYQFGWRDLDEVLD